MDASALTLFDTATSAVAETSSYVQALTAAFESVEPSSPGCAVSRTPYLRKLHKSRKGRFGRQHQQWINESARRVTDSYANETKRLTAAALKQLGRVDDAHVSVCVAYMAAVIREYSASFKTRNLPVALARGAVQRATLVNCEVFQGSRRVIVGRCPLDIAAEMLADGRIEGIGAADQSDYQAYEQQLVASALDEAVAISPDV